MERPDTSFKIEYSWLPREYGSEIEKFTLADLAIFCGASCATELEDILAKTVRSSARLSALRLAEWFAANWWRLRWEPPANTFSWKMSHKTGNSGGGYIWPDLSFSSDWESIHVSARPTAGWEGEPIRYLKDFDTRISTSAFEKGIDDFVAGTIARLSSTLATPTELDELWEQLTEERSDPATTEFRKLEACMGYDPDEAPEGLIASLQEAKKFYGGDAVQEVAAVSKSETLTHIKTLWEDVGKSRDVVQLHNCDGIRRRIAAQSNNFDLPWVRARRAAGIAREAWGLHGPATTQQLSKMFGIPSEAILQGTGNAAPPLTAGVRNDNVQEQFRFLSNRRHPGSRRFAFARLIADHLTALDNERLLPATDSRTGRQKFQRAFAQEFLCPFDDLKLRFHADIPTGDEIQDAAEYYDVSPRLIETTLVNNGMLDRGTLDDWLG